MPDRVSQSGHVQPLLVESWMSCPSIENQDPRIRDSRYSWRRNPCIAEHMQHTHTSDWPASIGARCNPLKRRSLRLAICLPWPCWWFRRGSRMVTAASSTTSPHLASMASPVQSNAACLCESPFSTVAISGLSCAALCALANSYFQRPLRLPSSLFPTAAQSYGFCRSSKYKQTHTVEVLPEEPSCHSSRRRLQFWLVARAPRILPTVRTACC